MRRTFVALAVGVLVLSPAPSGLSQQAAQIEFVPHEVATGLRGGYQVVATDMNRDGKPDLIAVASSMPDLVWFENPGWQRHVLASGLRGAINVAAADIDGDGIPELALAHGFAMTVAQSAGNVSLLSHSADVRQPWTIREIDRTATAHRVRWFKRPDANEYWLLNAPLIGDTLRAPDYKGHTPIYLYKPPEWKRETIPGPEEGVVHSIEISPAGFASASFLGVTMHLYQPGTRDFRRSLIVPRSGDVETRRQTSEVVFPRYVGGEGIVTVEPWHGNSVVEHVYTADARFRIVIDSTLTDAHTLLAADFDGDGLDEVVAGERGGQRSVRIYKRNKTPPPYWTRTVLDAGSMAAAGCATADFNADGKIDLACIGTATANLKWYENVSRRN